MNAESAYIPALKYSWLTKLYDFLMRNFLREEVFKSKLIESVRVINPEHILDIGCGTATLTIKLAKAFPDACVTGLDGDPDILRIAQHKIDNSKLKVRLIEGMSFNAPIDSNLFDLVTSSLMLHHLNAVNKYETLKEVHRVLKPEGMISIADWGAPSNFLMRLTFYLVQILDGFETTADNVNGRIPEFLERAGFKEVKELERVNTLFGTISLYSAKKIRNLKIL